MEFTKLGKRCQALHCNQHEYLPFECKYCNKFHCTNHASDHECTEKKNQGDRKVIQCPTCAKGIYYSGNKDVDLLFEQHYANECSKKMDQRTHFKNGKKKPKVCAAEKCLKRITEVSKFVCKKCKRDLCLTCRIPEQHNCNVPYKKTCADEVVNTDNLTVNFMLMSVH